MLAVTEREKTIKPLRGVEDIREIKGPHGGAVWVLTLACGHSVAKPIPTAHYVASMVACGVPVERFFAPKRSRCWLCPEEPRKTRRRRAQP